MKKCFIFRHKKQSAISETYGNNMRMRVMHRFEIPTQQCTCIQYVHSVYHAECTKCIIIGIIWMVTEVYESHRLLANLKRQNGMVKNTAFLSICILLILPSVIINNKDLLKTWLIFNFYAQFSLKEIGIISYCWTLIPL